MIKHGKYYKDNDDFVKTLIEKWAPVLDNPLKEPRELKDVIIVESEESPYIPDETIPDVPDKEYYERIRKREEQRKTT